MQIFNQFSNILITISFPRLIVLMVEQSPLEPFFRGTGRTRQKQKQAAFCLKSFRSSSICNAFSSATEICSLYFQNNAKYLLLVAAAAAPFLEKGGME
ncbi:hypothetical protein CDAR_564601 [Caerostris darwini]|uniref:Uncharacterized protein n=1 Tax=Caerostris darwini TaxID=1538125 RepID=A0AAV4TLA6_9ARAC|nr:hypothetical protein CDAR_564601 [Caerostris darwini]